MDYDLIWDNEQQTIIRWHPHSSLDPQQLEQQHLHLHQLMYSIPHYVDVVIEFNHVETPPSEDALQIIFSEDLLMRSNGLFILIGCLPPIRETIQQWIQNHPKYSQIIAFVDSLEEARFTLTDPDDMAKSSSETYELYWHIPGRVIYLKILENISLEDVTQLSDDITGMLDKAEGTINILCDFSNVEQVTIRPQPMRDAMTFLGHHKLGWIITFQANRYIVFLFSMIFQLASTRNKNVETFDDAIYFLQHELKQTL